eukprot:884180_1
MVVLLYCLYKLYLKQKQKVVEEDQVVVMAVNQNKPKPQQDSEPKQEDDILDNEEDSSDGDSLYVIDTQNGDKTTATNDIAIDEKEKSEKSSSRDSDDIYEGNENSVSDSDQFRVRG